MSKVKSLSDRQLAVIDDLFEGKKQQEILEKHKLSRKIYSRWLADEAFTSRLDWRVQFEKRLTDLMLARSARQAVSELTGLTKSKQPETARKACLDIIKISANRAAGKPATQGENPTSPTESADFSPETTGKLLAVLAEEKRA